MASARSASGTAPASKETPSEPIQDLKNLDFNVVGFREMSGSSSRAGKTTTVRLISHLLTRQGLRVGMTSTDGVYIEGQRIDTGDCSGPKRARNVLQLIDAGGNAYYLATFAGIFHLDMQDIGAQQTGMTKEAFKAKLVAAGL